MTRETPPAVRTSRRVLLVGGASALAMAACGGRADDDLDGGSEGPGTGLKAVQLFAAFAYEAIDPGVFAPGIEQRAPFVLLAADGVPLADGPDTIEVTLTDDAGQTVSTTTVSRHDEGIPGAYYPLVFTVDEPGRYVASTNVEGIESDAYFFVAERDKVVLAQVGDQLEPVATPTAADPLATDPICTRKPACPLHDTSFADLIGAGRPSAVLVSTPAYCQTVICGPVLDLAIDEAAALDDLDLVHAEVYKDAAATGQVIGATLTEAALSVPGGLFEPSLIVADAEGIVTARLDFSFDRAEIAAALATAIR